MGIRSKTVNGRQYYYLEETVRLEKPVVFSIYVGRKIPGKDELEKKKQELQDKIFNELLGGAARLYLTREQLIEAEKKRRQYEAKMKRRGKGARDEKEEIDTVNFVYTTLSTEGVPVTMEDAGLAYRFSQKNAKSVRDENLQVALDMINGVRFVKESAKGISLEFIRKLHGIVMAEFKQKNPGVFRRKQAFIYLKSYEKAEEIGFRPPPPAEIEGKLAELVEWYNANLGKLDGLELAAILHLRFYRIHPFEDGNKRVSRLLFNKALFEAGYPLLNVSKETQAYFDALINSVEKNDERPFIEFVYRKFIETI